MSQYPYHRSGEEDEDEEEIDEPVCGLLKL
jgi:hypothetical protein